MTGYELLLLCAALLIGAVALAMWLGSYERRWRARYAQMLEEREARLVGMIADGVPLYRDGVAERITPGIVVGQSAVSTRYFGPVLPDFRSRHGLTSAQRYAMLCQLARREAVVVLLESAAERGFNAVCGITIDTADLGHTLNRAQRAMIIITATGTGYRVA